MTDTAIWTWIFRTALGGGVLLFFAWLVQRRLREPLRQQRLGEWSVAAALLVAIVGLLPAWLVISVPVMAPGAWAPPEPAARELQDDFVPFEHVGHGDPDVVPQAAPVNTPATAPAPPAWGVAEVAVAVYAGVAVIVLGRWLLANLAVWWLLRKREAVPLHLRELFGEMCWPRRSRLIVTNRVDVPFSVGLWRPTVVLPGKLVEQATTEELRWVLAHELSHLERQDTRTCWLFVLGQVVYFYLPWFWWLRRRVRLSQEFIADAAAIEWAGSPADYAQFLVSWAGRPVAAGTGVSGSGSDLFRRVTKMLEMKPFESRTSRRWVVGLGSSLVALGLVLGGLGLQAVSADDKKPEEQKPQQKQPKQQKQAAPRQNFQGLFDGLPDGFDEKRLEEIQKKVAEAQKQVEKMMKDLENQKFPGGFGGAFAIPPGQFQAFGGFQPRTARLGAQVRQPSPTLVDQLDLPKDQGVVLEDVGANSAAAKAGLKAHDVLLELNGKTVSSKVNEFAKMVAEIKADTPVDAVVLRKGKKETIKGLKLPEAKTVAFSQGMPGFGVQGFPGGAQNLFGRGQALAQAGGKGGASTAISRNNDEFSVAHSEGGVKINVKGTIDQGKAKVSEVVIEEGNGQKATYDSMDKVPGTHKEKVKKLAEMAATGVVNLPM